MNSVDLNQDTSCLRWTMAKFVGLVYVCLVMDGKEKDAFLIRQYDGVDN